MTPVVSVHPADDGGCGRYRLRYPAEAAGLAIGPPITDLARLTGRHLHDITVPDADIIVTQRPLTRKAWLVVAALRRHGRIVVIDMDDDLHALPERHPARWGCDPRWATTDEVQRLANEAGEPIHTTARITTTDGATLHKLPAGWISDVGHHWVQRALTAADAVTVSTPALARRYGGTVLPNMVPARHLDVTAPRHKGLTVGWAGSVATHPGDLETTGGGIATALATAGANFRVVGTGAGVGQRLGLDDLTWRPGQTRAKATATGWVDIDDYPAAYAALDVAIVPLAPHAFNEAKSWLKGLEAASVGVPFVASPTGEYRRLHEMGAGLLAVGADEWDRAVTDLVSNPDRRATLAAAGRDVARGLLYEDHADRWVGAWTAAARKATT